jgi:hypothetical protein
MTNEERIKILEMVAAGKLTVEQASQLMDKLGTKSTTDAAKRPDQGQRSGGYTQETIGRIRGYRKSGDTVLTEAGLANFPARQIAALKNYGVDADYIRALQEAGLADLTVRQVISLYNYGVDADDVRALREDGVAGPTVERLLSLKKYGV